MKGHSGVIICVSFSADGGRIVTGGEDKLAIIWNAKTGKQLGLPLKGHSGTIFSVKFSPDGTMIITGSNDKLVII